MFGIGSSIVNTFKDYSDFYHKVKGTVYIHSTNSGPIRKDHFFEFSSRLQTVDRKPILIKEDDFYLELFGKIEGDFRINPKNGVPHHFTYLPSSLFEGVKEGDTIQFYFDDRLIELCCRQKTHSHPAGASWTFEDFMESVRAEVRNSHIQCLWKEDIKGEPSFISWVQLNSHEGKGRDFQFYQEDQKLNGAYQQLQGIKSNKHDILFYFHSKYGVDISEIDLVESRGVNGLRQLWVLIPHRPEKNKIPEPEDASESIRYFEGDIETFNKQTFDPQKGHRVLCYSYGQHAVATINEDINIVNISFNQQGWLQLSMQSQPKPSLYTLKV